MLLLKLQIPNMVTFHGCHAFSCMGYKLPLPSPLLVMYGAPFSICYACSIGYYEYKLLRKYIYTTK